MVYSSVYSVATAEGAQRLSKIRLLFISEMSAAQIRGSTSTSSRILLYPGSQKALLDEQKLGECSRRESQVARVYQADVKRFRKREIRRERCYVGVVVHLSHDFVGINLGRQILTVISRHHFSETRCLKLGAAVLLVDNILHDARRRALSNRLSSKNPNFSQIILTHGFVIKHKCGIESTGNIQRFFNSVGQCHAFEIALGNNNLSWIKANDLRCMVRVRQGVENTI